MTEALRIAEDSLENADVLALLALHLAEMRRWSPACKVHALPAESLRQPGVTVFAAWAGSAVAGIGALRLVEPGHGEIKSMRVAPAFRGTGVGEAILVHLMAEARARGWSRLSLETGRAEPFAPAIGLYRKHGFEECAAFAAYVADDFSVCMTRPI